MDVFGPIHTKIFTYYSHTIHVTIHITYSCHYSLHYSCHYSHKPGTVFNSPKNRTVGCPWAAHSPNVGSSWWNINSIPISGLLLTKTQFIVTDCPNGFQKFPHFGFKIWDRSNGHSWPQTNTSIYKTLKSRVKQVG